MAHAERARLELHVACEESVECCPRAVVEQLADLFRTEECQAIPSSRESQARFPYPTLLTRTAFSRPC